MQNYNINPIKLISKKNRLDLCQQTTEVPNMVRRNKCYTDKTVYCLSKMELHYKERIWIKYVCYHFPTVEATWSCTICILSEAYISSLLGSRSTTPKVTPRCTTFSTNFCIVTKSDQYFRLCRKYKNQHSKLHMLFYHKSMLIGHLQLSNTV